MRLEPQQREGADQIGHFGVRGAGDMDALFGEVDARRSDAPVTDQPLFKLRNTACAADIGDREVALDQRRGGGDAHCRSIR
jgi:hypothetical protein